MYLRGNLIGHGGVTPQALVSQPFGINFASKTFASPAFQSLIHWFNRIEILILWLQIAALEALLNSIRVFRHDTIVSNKRLEQNSIS